MPRQSLARPTLLSVVAALLLSLPTLTAAGPQEGPHGIWNGAIKVPGQPLDVVVTLQQRSDGAWAGTIDIPAQGLADFPLSDVTLDAGTVGFVMTGVPGEPRFTGTWNPTEATISGDFEQGGATFPFSLSRSGDAPAAAESGSVDADTAARVVGTWSGELAAGGSQLRIVFHFTYADGTLAGTFDSPDQGQTGLPVSALTFDGTTLRADLRYAGAYFEGTLSADGSSLVGSWNQGGGAGALTLQKQ